MCQGLIDNRVKLIEVTSPARSADNVSLSSAAAQVPAQPLR